MTQQNSVFKLMIALVNFNQPYFVTFALMIETFFIILEVVMLTIIGALVGHQERGSNYREISGMVMNQPFLHIMAIFVVRVIYQN
jgi:hypothetical protein